MSPKISFIKSPKAKTDVVILCVYEGGKLSPSAKEFDLKSAKGLLGTAIETSPKFTGKTGQHITVSLPKGAGFAKAILFGLGDIKKLSPLEIEASAGNLTPILRGTGAKTFAVMIDEEKGLSISTEELAARIANGFLLRSYSFTKYKKPDTNQTEIDTIDIVLEKITAASKRFKDFAHTAEGVFLARDVMNEPPNVLYPESYAKRIQKELKPLGIEVDILDEKQMEKMGFHAHIAVGKGSERQPRVVIMRWHGKPSEAKGAAKAGGKFSKPPLALVGKGVTFDTGGISIKPAAGMEAMKMDMGGSAAVVGLMKTLALRGSKAQVVGIVGLAENMPSANSYRPGDIIQSMGGKTIEVLNTDAEGRLILVDALTYVQRTYKPKAIVDLATLTGAMMVALGLEYCGAFVNNDELWKQLEISSKETGEKLWRMPLDEAYRKMMEGKFSDLNNLGDASRYGGACTAAGFLEVFIENNTPWAHLDIAGKMDQKADKGTTTAGGVGFGVRLLDHLISTCYE